MAAGITQMTVLDGGSTSRSVQVWSSTGAITGNLNPLQALVGADGANIASAANGLPVTIENASLTIAAATHTQTSALAATLVVKASAGTLYGLEVSADSTLAGEAFWVMIFDATSAPADGAVTPAKVYAAPSGTLQWGASFGPGGVAFTTGISVAVSTTGPFTKTAAGSHAFIGGDFI